MQASPVVARTHGRPGGRFATFTQRNEAMSGLQPQQGTPAATHGSSSTHQHEPLPSVNECRSLSPLSPSNSSEMWQACNAIFGLSTKPACSLSLAPPTPTAAPPPSLSTSSSTPSAGEGGGGGGEPRRRTKLPTVSPDRSAATAAVAAAATDVAAPAACEGEDSVLLFGGGP